MSQRDPPQPPSKTPTEVDKPTSVAPPKDVDNPEAGVAHKDADPATDSVTVTVSGAEAKPELDIGNLYNNLSDRFDKLRASCNQIRASVDSRVYDLSTKEGYETLRTDYKQWLSGFESYLDCETQFCHSIEAKDLESYHEQVQKDRDSFLRDFKSEISAVLNKAPFVQRPSRASSKWGSHKTSSSMRSLHLKEEKQRAEIQARLQSLEKVNALKQAEFELQLKREAYELETQLEIATARANVHRRPEFRDSESEHGTDPDDRDTISYHSDTHHTRDGVPRDTDKVQFNTKTATATGKATNADATKETSRGGARPRDGRDTTDSQHNSPIHPPGVTTPQHIVTSTPDNGIDTQRTHVGRRLCFDVSDQQTPSVQHHDEQQHSAHEQSNTSNRTVTDEQFVSVAKLFKRPAIEITKFSGNPTEFFRFKRQFNARLASICDDDDERLSYLEQYTTGDAKKIVRGFSNLPASHGYAAALTELDKRYGDPHVVSQAYIEQVMNWSILKVDDTKSFDDFSVFLTECLYSIDSVRGLDALNYPENLKRVIQKLPFTMHDRWRSEAHRLHNTNTVIKFEHIVSYVKKEAEKMRDSVFGRDALRQQGKQSTVKAKVLATNVEPKSKKKNGRRNNSVSNSTGDANTVNMVSGTPTDGVKGDVVQRGCFLCKLTYHPLDVCKEFNGLSYEQRVNVVKQNKLCFGCLKRNHMKKACTRKLVCQVCSKYHPTSLHDNNFTPKQTQTQCEEPDNNQSEVSCAGSLTEAGNKFCTLSIVPVSVSLKGNAHSVQTYAFLDPGSNVSFCTNTLLQDIGAQGKPVQIKVETMGNTCTMNTKLAKNIQVNGPHGHVVQLPELYTKDHMPVKKRHIPTNDDIKKWPHLQDVELPSITGDIGLLIGSNAPDVYTPFEMRTGPSGAPHATRTAIGWIPWNVIRDLDDQDYVVNRLDAMVIQDSKDLTQLERAMKNTINVDFPERLIDDKKEDSLEDRCFKQKVNKSVAHSDGHYYIDIPFKQDEVTMPSNKQYVMKRQQNLKRKLDGDPQFKGEYQAFMETLLEKGYAEKAPDLDDTTSNGKCWYIPHHGVRHPTKHKLRVVFDCAASYEGVSLNEQLLQGPNLTNSLIGVLLRFREEHVAVMGDIEAMYHQVRVPEKDRDYLRFLWWPGGDTSQPLQEYRMCVHLFGATSSPACANYALRTTAKDSSYDSNTTDAMEKNFYVDDCLKSLPTTEEAVKFIEDITTVCAQGGFNITKWVSNSREVNQSLKEEQKAKQIKHLDVKDALPINRALGVIWNVETDCINFVVSIPNKPATRRNLLSITSSLFDPLGLASPFVLPAKILQQELCQQGKEWDEPLSDQQTKRWNNWLEDLPHLQGMQIPRCIKPTTDAAVFEKQLHHFCDASDSGYGVASYLRQTFSDGTVHCTLLMGKSRVVPLKKMTVPRLELTAAKLAVLANKMITDELDIAIDKVFFWTDSMSVIRYINNEVTRFHTFVANRLVIIHEGSSSDQWRHVDSANNPADYASRGISTTDLDKVNKWLHGPEFLMQDEKHWPHRIPEASLHTDDPEVKKAACATVKAEPDFIDRFSSLQRAKKVTAWILKYKRNLQRWSARRKILDETLTTTINDEEKRTKKVDAQIKMEQQSTKVNVPVLCVDDLEEAEEVLIKIEQNKFFKEEIVRLTVGQPIKKSSRLRRLNPLLVEDVLRVGGRLSRAPLRLESKHPAIIPKGSRLAELIVQESHRRLGHSGRNATLADINSRYWVINIGTLVKSLLSKCVICRKYNALKMQQKMADLPTSRLAVEAPPFTNTGCDFFGPFEIKRGRSIVKRYGVIFTCLTTRAVHLEVADSLDTDSCINAIRRFISRRGPVRSVTSDNGSNFVSANSQLKAALQGIDNSKIAHLLLDKGIEWVFNPPTGSHFGGVWERLIRSVRKILTGLLKEQTVRLTDDSLQTLMCEVEYIMNNRPITKVSTDPCDLEALTPNHLLLGRTTGINVPGVFSHSDNYVRRRWRQVQYLSDLFWKRFVSEYMPLLQERQKWLTPKRNVQLDDVVLLVDNTPRTSWALGKVTDVLPDKHGIVRIAKVKTKGTVLHRPIDKLVMVLESDNP